jgi:hypothetical protein
MSTLRRRSRSRGSSIIEFTFVGIPLIFVLISIFEGARGMWIYSTMAHAMKEGNRYAIVRGYAFKQNCEGVLGAGNAGCQLTLQKIAQTIQNSGPGLIPSDIINLQVTVNGTSFTCGSPSTLQSCLSSGAAIPSPATNLVAGNTFVISAQYRFANAIAMFWPGAGPGRVFGTFNLPASSQDTIQY